MRATYKIENAIGGKTNVDPKSGCLKIKNIGQTKQNPSLQIPLSESFKFPISDLAIILAPRISVTIFANSDGCILNSPKSIHLCAPYFLGPQKNKYQRNNSQYIDNMSKSHPKMIIHDRDNYIN